MNKNKCFALVAGLAIIGFLFTGCATTPEKTTKKETYVAPTDLTGCKTFQEAGKKMITSVMTGLATKNYALYSRDFSEKNKKYFDAELFAKAADAVSSELGEFQGEKYIGSWQKGDYSIMLWKARFSETKDDVLVQMYIKKFDGIYKIAALKLI